MSLFISLFNWKKLLGMFIVVFLIPSFLMGQASRKDITGRVVDDENNPIGGITVTVKNGNTATSTNADGSFGIKANIGNILIFTSVGYETVEVAISSTESLIIVLNEKKEILSDVVVIGYGKGSKKTLSSSITSIKPEELNKVVTGDIGQLLQGKVAGLNITASGDPNRSASVTLRGPSTINSPGGPFYVIDGVPGADIAAIAPDDIASIDVLKDAAATAIYGNKASNGVIMVTTKKGRTGKMQASYNGYVGLEKVSGELDVMNADQIKAFVAKSGISISPNDDFGKNTNWMKAVERPQAISQNHNISFSGGSEKSLYSASLNYLNKEGILLKSNLQRVIARLSLEQFVLNDKVKLGLNLSNASSKAQNTPLRNVVLLQAAKHLPVSPIYNDDGSYFENFNTPGYYNPLSLINNAQDDTKYNTLLGNFTVEANLPWNFKYNLNASYQKNTSLHGEYYNSYYSSNYKSGFYNNPDPGFSGRWLLSFGTNGAAYRSAYENNSTTVESFLTWDKKINRHSINSVLGYSWQENNWGDGLQANNTNFVSDYTGYYNLGLGNYNAVNGYVVDFGNTVFQTTRFISDFLRVNYNFAEKYLLQASIRRDGSSVFGTNNQWGYFPAIGVAWRINEEEFLKNSNLISDLKLRFSYGETGNAFGFGAYTAKQLFSSRGTYYNAGVFATAIGVTQGSNPDLKWEVTSTKNLGLDFGLLQNKISGTLDFYEKTTTNMIFGYSVSNTIVPGGFVWGNGGKIRNRGIELTLSATPVSNKVFRWNTSANFAVNKNLILNMDGPEKYGVSSDSIRYTRPEGPGQTNTSLQILKEGYPIGQFFAFSYAGKDANGNSQFVKKQDGSLTTAPAIGDDYFYLANPHPKLLLGWNNTLNYKNFDFNFFFRGVFGNKIFNATRADLSYTVNAAVINISNQAVNDLMTDAKNNSYSDRYIENGSYVRLDNATLGYKVPVQNNIIKSLRLYVTGNNLLVVTKYSGIDPEINQGGIALGVDYNNFYPKTRIIMFGLNFGF